MNSAVIGRNFKKAQIIDTLINLKRFQFFSEQVQRKIYWDIMLVFIYAYISAELNKYDNFIFTIFSLTGA